MLNHFLSRCSDSKPLRSNSRLGYDRRYTWPGLIIITTVFAMWLHGPIAQLADYHHFADRRVWLGIPNAADVLSNFGFALVGIWGLSRLWLQRDRISRLNGAAGYGLFLVALLATAAGSGWYHLAPDNVRLVWDRLPIALACAGLMAAVWRDTVGGRHWITALFAMLAVLSVAWWRYTDLQGVGDLRPYLLVQCLPLGLIPLLQWQYGVAWEIRRACFLAIGLYVLAKVCELSDHAILAILGGLSGHTLKHLLAILAATVLTGCFTWQLRQLD